MIVPSRNIVVGRSDRHTAREVGGNSRFVRELYKSLEGLGAEVRVMSPRIRTPWNAVNSSLYAAWEGALLPVLAARRGCDVLHYTSDTGPVSEIMSPLPVVVTVHGIASLTIPGVRSSRHEWLWRRRVESALKVADRVATDSTSSAQDISALFDVPISDIHVIPPGIDVGFFRPAGVGEQGQAFATASRLGISQPYVLFFGNVNDPKKNLLGAIEATRLARSEISNLKVVVSGSPVWRGGWDGVNSDVAHYVGRLEDLQLRDLIWASEAVLVPSLYEGFGFPALEALACASPVVSSSSGSMPEVVGSVALTPDPTDLHAIAAAIVEAVSDVSARARQRTLGPELARSFTWENCASAYLGLFSSLTAD
ncbi:hypothetical protein BH10ACT2_BH10ACT2_20960 [soil metagenome]